MSIEALPLNLYKANTELQLRLTRLLQESGHRWLEATQQASSENISETTAEIEGLLRSANWQSLTTLPAESFWRLFSSRASPIRRRSTRSQSRIKPPSPLVCSKRWKAGKSR